MIKLPVYRSKTIAPTPAARGARASSLINELADIRIDYQQLRHGRFARLMRGLLYRLIIGREGWPLVFQAPASPGDVPQGVSPHLYVHLPFCRQICPHCPYTKTLYHRPSHSRYSQALGRELQHYLRRKEIPPVASLYFGGGTPTVTPDLIEQTIASVKPFLVPGAEIGVEVHPADAEAGMLERYRNMGVTRISLGIESFREDLLRLLARRYTPEQAEEALRCARATGFECVDVNLIFGIPGQREEDPAADARRCLEVGVDQISAYQLFTFVYTPLGRRVRHGEFPIYSDLTRLRAQKRLTEACLHGGLERTSPWNFTRPGISPYSTVTQEDYIGFGAGAGSKVDGVFWFNTFSIDAYIEAEEPRPALVMQTDDRFRCAHWLYWRLYRTVVDPAHYRLLFNRDLARDFGGTLALLRMLGMARRDGELWRVTESGAIWMHRLQQLFSITYIDDLWEHCQGESWPREVVLA